MSVLEYACAKVNLTLGVLGRRPDGYHELESLVTFADIHDVVTLEPGAASSVVVAGPFAEYIGGENLLIRALAALREIDPDLSLGAVRLEKRLPVAAGVGGGSADAAALLRAVRRASPRRAGAIEWLRAAERLGADVPVCFVSKPALIRGKGEKIAPCVRLPPVSAVLVNPRLPLETTQVFAALAAGPVAAGEPRSQAPPEFADLESLVDYMRACGNDLERPAIGLMPVIGEMKAALEAQPDCRLAAMSGSGPTCLGLFPGRESAHRAAERIGAAQPGWWVAATMLTGAPAP